MARPVTWTKEKCKKLAKKMDKYFDVVPNKLVTETFYYKNGDEKVKEVELANNLPLIQGFCAENDLSQDTFYRLVKMKKKVDTELGEMDSKELEHPELTESYKRARTKQEYIWITNSMKGLYAPAFSIFSGKNMFGWRDERHLDHTSKGEKIVFEIPKEIAKKRELTPITKSNSE